MGEATPAAAAAGRRPAGLHRTSVAVGLIGAVATIGLSLAAGATHERSEDALLRQRVREGASVIRGTLPSIQTPLAVAAELAEVTRGPSADSVERAVGQLVGPDRRFASVSIWEVGSTKPVRVVGVAPKLADEPEARIRDVLERATSASRLAVVGLFAGTDVRVGYAYATRGAGARFVAYGEAALPADRGSVALEFSAFDNVEYALYLGRSVDPNRLVVANSPEIPLRGRVAQANLSFGDATFLLVMSPTGRLSGALSAWLPFIALGLGVLTTAAAAGVTERLLRRRREAEDLAGENERLYDQQRRVAHTLQRSLLPQRLPEIAGVELAVRYVPGVEGMEIGGDWYDIVALGPHRFFLAVGDVSGRGLRAASVMASVRFATRAYAVDGDPPGTILTKLGAIDDPDREGHFTTVLCALVELGTAGASLANAGHPAPLLIDGVSTRFVDTQVGPPIGAAPGTPYESTTIAVPPGATLLLFTDGLFERRGETVDDGMARLREAVGRHLGTLEELLDGVVNDLLGTHSADDAAIVGVRWKM